MQDDIISLISEYQKADDLEIRLAWAEKIACVVGPPLKAYILNRYPEGFDEVFSRTLEGLFNSLPRFGGKTPQSAWSYCYSIAQFKIKDELRKKKQRESRFVLVETEEWAEMFQADEGLSAGDRLDFEYVIDLIRAAKPDCVDFLYHRIALRWEFKAIAKRHGLLIPSARRRTERCLEYAMSLVKKKL